MERFEPAAIERLETASLMVWLRSDGSVTRVEPNLSSSPEANQNAMESLKAASPYPPPARYVGCSIHLPIMVQLSIRLPPDCEQIPEVVAYRKTVFRQIVDRFHATQGAREAGSGTLIFTLNPDGGVARVSVADSSSDRFTARATASVNDAAPFASPPEFSACGHLPLFLSLETSAR